MFDEDVFFIEQTLELAAKGWGGVRPNPMVGAVVVRSGSVVSTGYHRVYRGPHAEGIALDLAGHLSKGATLYCSLEPCCYRAPEKHQPPCTERIISAGISRVVICQIDPNPKVSGRGIAALRAAGISVDIVGDQAAAWRLNDAFNTAATLQRPFVHLKMAQSIDGRIATAAGESRWITGPESRCEAHRLRAGRDAVLVGVGTANADDPRLTVRLHDRNGDSVGNTSDRQPVPVVIDPALRINPRSYLTTNRPREVVIVAAKSASAARRKELEGRGVRILEAARGDDGIPVDQLLALLWSLGIRSVLVEGGARVHGYFLRSGIYDRVTVFVAPRFIGASGIAAVDSLDIYELSESLNLEHVSSRLLGADLMVEGYRPGWLAETAEKIEETLHVHRVG